MGGLNDFSRMAKDLRELDGREDEQAAGPALGSGTASREAKCANKNGGGGTILVPEYGCPQELPPSSVIQSTQEGQSVSVHRVGHQCCQEQILHTMAWHLPEEENMPNQSPRGINSRERG